MDVWWGTHIKNSFLVYVLYVDGLDDMEESKPQEVKPTTTPPTTTTTTALIEEEVNYSKLQLDLYRDECIVTVDIPSIAMPASVKIGYNARQVGVHVDGHDSITTTVKRIFESAVQRFGTAGESKHVGGLDGATIIDDPSFRQWKYGQTMRFISADGGIGYVFGVGGNSAPAYMLTSTPDKYTLVKAMTMKSGSSDTPVSMTISYKLGQPQISRGLKINIPTLRTTTMATDKSKTMEATILRTMSITLPDTIPDERIDGNIHEFAATTKLVNIIDGYYDKSSSHQTASSSRSLAMMAPQHQSVSEYSTSSSSSSPSQSAMPVPKSDQSDSTSVTSLFVDSISPNEVVESEQPLGRCEYRHNSYFEIHDPGSIERGNPSSYLELRSGGGGSGGVETHFSDNGRVNISVSGKNLACAQIHTGNELFMPQNTVAYVEMGRNTNIGIVYTRTNTVKDRQGRTTKYMATLDLVNSNTQDEEMVAIYFHQPSLEDIKFSNVSNNCKIKATTDTKRRYLCILQPGSTCTGIGVEVTLQVN